MTKCDYHLEIRKKLMDFFQSSVIFEAVAVIGLMPHDYLHKERALLLAKSKNYSEALDICIN